MLFTLRRIAIIEHQDKDEIDINSGSDPKSINKNDSGFIPDAILGREAISMLVMSSKTKLSLQDMELVSE